MIQRSLLVVCCITILVVGHGHAVPLPRHQSPADDLEKRAIRALSESNEGDLKQIQKEIARLDGPARADLRFRIFDKSVEFEFAGVFPGSETQVESLEYLISLNPHKNHETLLAVRQSEMDRLALLRPLFTPQRNDRRTRLLESRMCWIDGMQQRSVGVADILTEPAKIHDDFMKQLEINEHGLGGSQNVKGQRAILPQEKIEARMIVVVQRGR